MHILENVPLKLYSTMRLGGEAAYLVNVRSRSELEKAVEWAEKQQIPLMMIGGGSNIIWRDEGFKGLLIVNKIPGFKIIHEDADTATVMIGAGKDWDKAVAETVALDLSGIESLSLIPGSTGATPVQNVGAYGQEIAHTLQFVEAYDLFEKQFVVLTNDQCAFGYRTSRFKTVDKGRFLIVSITLKLSKHNSTLPPYRDVEAYFKKHNLTNPTPANIRKAVVDIRSHKLPDPTKVANNGSFFGNPVVSADEYKKIKRKYPAIEKIPAGWTQAPRWVLRDGSVKLAAGWLVEQAGFKDFQDKETGMAIWKNQSLVLINEKARTTADLLNFRAKIVDKVYEMFGVTLEQEPELLP